MLSKHVFQPELSSNVLFYNFIYKNENIVELDNVPDFSDLDYFLVNEVNVAVVRLTVKPENGDLVVLRYNKRLYAGKYEQVAELNLIVLEMEDSLILADIQEVKGVFKLIGICRKDNDYRFAPVN